MPFEDEVQVVELASWTPRWESEFEALARQLRETLGDVAVAIQHIGSTSIPELLAKDVIDIQVLVRQIPDGRIEDALAGLGLRRRPEPWNQADVIGSEELPKQVYAPPLGARAANIHVRAENGGAARYALLFRDFLRADTEAREAWGEFKLRLASAVDDLAAYGQIKGAAFPLLMRCAEAWAAESAWLPSR